MAVGRVTGDTLSVVWVVRDLVVGVLGSAFLTPTEFAFEGIGDFRPDSLFLGLPRDRDGLSDPDSEVLVLRVGVFLLVEERPRDILLGDGPFDLDFDLRVSIFTVSVVTE